MSALLMCLQRVAARLLSWLMPWTDGHRQAGRPHLGSLGGALNSMLLQLCAVFKRQAGGAARRPRHAFATPFLHTKPRLTPHVTCSS